MRSWVRADLAELDAALHAAVSRWLAEEWPFAAVDYADARLAAGRQEEASEQRDARAAPRERLAEQRAQRACGEVRRGRQHHGRPEGEQRRRREAIG